MGRALKEEAAEASKYREAYLKMAKKYLDTAEALEAKKKLISEDQTADELSVAPDFVH